MLIRLSLLIMALALVGKCWYWAKDGFDLRKIGTISSVSENSSEEFAYPDAILNQPFVYLGRGRQSFAFESQDGKYILKLPRIDRYKTPLWLKSIPFLERNAKASEAHKNMRKNFVFNSFRIAYEELKEETGVLYVHLEKTKALPAVVIVDPLGRSYRIELNQTIFLLQKKLPLGMPLLEKYIKEKDREKAKELINRFFDLAKIRARKGIFNRDSNFLGNFAYDGEKFFQIDVGSFHRRPDYPKSEEYRACLEEATAQLCHWLKKYDPELATWVKNLSQ